MPQKVYFNCVPGREWGIVKKLFPRRSLPTTVRFEVCPSMEPSLLRKFILIPRMWILPGVVLEWVKNTLGVLEKKFGSIFFFKRALPLSRQPPISQSFRPKYVMQGLPRLYPAVSYSSSINISETLYCAMMSLERLAKNRIAILSNRPWWSWTVLLPCLDPIIVLLALESLCRVLLDWAGSWLEDEIEKRTRKLTFWLVLPYVHSVPSCVVS